MSLCIGSHPILGRHKRVINFAITFTSDQLLVVTTQVRHMAWSFGFIQAKISYILRQPLWNDILSLGCHNLCIMGDVFIGSHERNKASSSSSLPSQELVAFIDEAGLFMVDSCGPRFTWSTRRRSYGFMAAKLDRVLVNQGFLVL